jgi:hypothetical protein
MRKRISKLFAKPQLHTQGTVVKELTGIGFWRSFFEPLLPDPARFVDELWPEAEKQRVTAYLKQGRRLHAWMGYSWCRFRCGVDDVAMGAWDLTDGIYCWPGGLLHYITEHNVRLPAVVEQYILSQPEFPHQQAAQVAEGSPTDRVWWSQQTGWNDSSSYWCGDEEEEMSWLRRFERKQVDFNETSPLPTQARELMIQSTRLKLHN